MCFSALLKDARYRQDICTRGEADGHFRGLSTFHYIQVTAETDKFGVGFTHASEVVVIARSAQFCRELNQGVEMPRFRSVRDLKLR